MKQHIDGDGFQLELETRRHHLHAYVHGGADSFEVSLSYWTLLAQACREFGMRRLLVATAAFTKSAKEAQTYISILYLLPMIPMLVGQFMDIKSTAQTMLIPFFSQYQLIDKVVKGETIIAGHVYTSVGGSLFVAVILLLIAFRLYRQDKILGN